MSASNYPAGDAAICISVSGRPGRFGNAVHTAGYRALGLNYVYLARTASEIAPVVAAVRTLGIRGCSVSMPFKTEVVAHLDAVDPLAASVGAVNTIVNEGGHLTGYNTDVAGVLAALQTVALPLRRALVLGAGGMSRAVVRALLELGVSDVFVAARRADRASAVVRGLAGQVIDWDQRSQLDADLLVNATSVGMAPSVSETPMPSMALPRFRVVADVIASPPETRLLADARAQGCLVVGGAQVAFHQALLQFRYYTGCEPPIEPMRLAAELCTGVKL